MKERDMKALAAAKARISVETRRLASGPRNRILNSVDRIARIARKASAPAPAPRPRKDRRPASDLDRLNSAQLRALLRYNDETFDEVAVQLSAMVVWDRHAQPYYYDHTLALIKLAGELINARFGYEDALRRAIQEGR